MTAHLRLSLLLAGLAALLALSGCAPTQWNRPGTTPQQFTMDNAGCRLAAKASTAGIPSLVEQSYDRVENFHLCMIANGYTPSRAP